MKYTIIILIMIAIVAKSQKLEQIQSIVNQTKDSVFYKEQAKLWEIETKKSSKNANAWFNYYRAVKYGNYTRHIYSNKNLITIMDKMKTDIPNSFVYNYLMYYNGGNNKKYANYLLKAYKIEPENPIAYPSLVTYCDIVGNTKLKNEVLIRWYNSNTYPVWKLYNAYNSLIGLDKNSIIISNGDNNVYAKQLLQATKKTRTDVKLILMSLLYIDNYYQKTLKELKISAKFENFNQFAQQNTKINGQELMNLLLAKRVEYIASSIKNKSVYIDNSGIEQVEEYLKDKLYLEGIVYKFSEKEYDNTARMQQNFEQKYLFDFIKFNYKPLNKYSSQKYVTGSYLTFLTELYNFYKLSYDINNKIKVEKLLKIIAKNIGIETEIHKLINE